ncbi:MAG: methyltransferase domain-containing protein [Phycisphaera sp.]|nr:methyltransferase domain-containing protein [Phycisphaera sp.]
MTTEMLDNPEVASGDDAAHGGHDAHADHMHRMYRFTRHVYDLSRKYYLLGRDRLLRQMVIKPGDRVLEMGCGTARNLRKLARMHPDHALYGLDAAQSMLDTAAASLDRTGLADRVTLRRCLAEQLDHRETFGLDEPFDVIFFSYSLSMMPTWSQAIDVAIANLAPGGRIYVVDFCDQADLPGWFAATLRRWLAVFQVHHRPELLARLERMRDTGDVDVTIDPILKRYAFIARIEHRA